uniref:Alpha-type protein kinase domain-containing protein n=1 Tax=Macrostomum lignano TaxID=282301 RepID=A0A1I8GUM3_9PLAT
TGQSRPPRRVRFADQIRAFLFERALGFSCVPSRGSVGLGMQLNHCAVESLAPHDRPVDDNNSSSSTGYSAAFGFRLAEDGQALSPLPVRSRRQLLRESGVRRADSAEERAECRLIRASGSAAAATVQTVAFWAFVRAPETRFLVDRAGFPCACARPEACANPAGRLEFNPSRVRAHYVHTAHRLSLESEQQQADLFTPDGSCSVCADVDNVQDQCSTMPLTGAPLLTAANDMPTAT